MWTPFTIAKLVSPRTMVYDTDNTYNLYITDRTYNYSSGGKKTTSNWRKPHCILGIVFPEKFMVSLLN